MSDASIGGEGSLCLGGRGREAKGCCGGVHEERVQRYCGFFLFPSLFDLSFLLTCCLVSCPALRVEKQKLSESIDEMKTLVRSSHNKAEEVITHAEEELMLAKLIRRGADRDLVQA